jgi:hypothetical protein
MATDMPSNLPQKNSSTGPTGPGEHSRRVAEMVSRLMNHYWTSNDHPAIRQAQIEDWIEDLSEFPIEIVEFACRQWRQTEKRRPTPAEIRKLAGVEMQRRESVLQRRLPDLSQTTEVIQRCKGLYGTCAGRYNQIGVVCFEECKDMVENYAGNHATWAF